MGFFNTTKGLCLGYPLSLFLFLIVMESFTAMFNVAINIDLLSGLKWVFYWILQILFADDSIIFSDGEFNQIQNLRRLLCCFEAVTRLKISSPKSKIALLGEVSDINSLVGILRFRVTSLPTFYLGLPFGASCKAINIWNGVLEKN